MTDRWVKFRDEGQAVCWWLEKKQLLEHPGGALKSAVRVPRAMQDKPMDDAPEFTHISCDKTADSDLHCWIIQMSLIMSKLTNHEKLAVAYYFFCGKDVFRGMRLSGIRSHSMFVRCLGSGREALRNELDRRGMLWVSE